MKEYNNLDRKLITDITGISRWNEHFRNSWMEQVKLHIIQMQKNMTPTSVLCILAKGCCKTIKQQKIHRKDNATAEQPEGDAPGLMRKGGNTV
jgi:hypothetical protein